MLYPLPMGADWRKKHPLAAWALGQVPGACLVAAAIFFSYLMIDKASDSKLSDLEMMLFQSVSLGLGLLGSFLVGKNSALSPVCSLPS